MKNDQHRTRAVIEGVQPEIDCGRFPIKRVVGEDVTVEADIFADGHEAVSAVLMYRKGCSGNWLEQPMVPLVNDRWRGRFQVTELGSYEYSLTAWADRFKTWQNDLRKRVDADQDVALEMLIGAEVLAETAESAEEPDRARLVDWAATLRSDDPVGSLKVDLALSLELAATMQRNSRREHATTYPVRLRVDVDREKARFSTWYEMFPRSTASEPDRHGTFKDCEARLPYVASMGFDVLYLPPIHPIGRVNRKGPNNNPAGAPADPGSPWAIGSAEGGHKAIDPALGTENDFKRLIGKAQDQGIEIALDIAFQCAPDHPYVKEHPEWFRWRPDGTVQYAENPPKKYEDIYPFEFDTDRAPELWNELKSVVDYWISLGIRIFRVDNPHTKPFGFWEWLIGEIRAAHPEVIFLSEAFTRPKVMYRLAKLGFSQSYTYFAWRRASWELSRYMTELTQTEVAEYFRPNLWPNTPDILTEQLQAGGRAAFMSRLVLAATLGASYGIYGPPFELQENRPREHGSEEYLDSEKYQVRHWKVESPHSLREFITWVNRIRRQNMALQSDRSLRFHGSDNDQLLCYSKRSPADDNIILTVVNLDPHHAQSGWVNVPAQDLGLAPDEPYQAHDLLTDSRFMWHGAWNYVELNPAVVPAHIFRVRQRLRSERDFDYFM